MCIYIYIYIHVEAPPARTLGQSLANVRSLPTANAQAPVHRLARPSQNRVQPHGAKTKCATAKTLLFLYIFVYVCKYFCKYFVYFYAFCSQVGYS